MSIMALLIHLPSMTLSVPLRIRQMQLHIKETGNHHGQNYILYQPERRRCKDNHNGGTGHHPTLSGVFQKRVLVVDLDLLPSSPDLTDIQDIIVHPPKKKRSYQSAGILRQALEPVLDAYDYILLDCPPNFSCMIKHNRHTKHKNTGGCIL